MTAVYTKHTRNLVFMMRQRGRDNISQRAVLLLQFE